MKNVLIIGATSAIAIACARLWAKENAKLFLVARNAEKLGQVADDLIVRGASVSQYVLDLNNYDQHGAMLSTCYSMLDKIDVVLIAHGTLPDQAACETDAGLAVQEFNNNGLNVIALLTHLAMKLESQKEGVLAVISSVAGDRGRPSNYLYGSAKAAVSAFCGGLRARLFKLGVHVLIIKPGFVDTPMTQHLSLPKALVVSPERVATDIMNAIAKRKDVLYTPWFWRYIMLIIIHIPGFVFKRLKM